jgi:hypothetical protein
MVKLKPARPLTDPVKTGGAGGGGKFAAGGTTVGGGWLGGVCPVAIPSIDAILIDSDPTSRASWSILIALDFFGQGLESAMIIPFQR